MSEREAINGALSACKCRGVSSPGDRVARPSEGPSGAQERYFVRGGVLFARLDGHEVPFGDVDLLLEAVFGRSE